MSNEWVIRGLAAAGSAIRFTIWGGACVAALGLQHLLAPQFVKFGLRPKN